MKFNVKNSRIAIAAVTVVVLLVLVGAYVFLAPALRSGTEGYVYVRSNATRADVLRQVDSLMSRPQSVGFYLLAAATGYYKNMHSGRYVIHDGDNVLTFFRALRGGRQEPVSITIPQVRTMRDLSRYLGQHLMLDSLKFFRAVSDSAVMSEFGLDTANAYCLFIPNTYEIYWNVTVHDFLKRMKREASGFWTKERLQKAAAIPLTPEQVYTLASIIDEETSNKAEKPDIAGMYINRLHKGMPLQADPTIKFALRNFSLRRIYHSLLGTQSPYNTYKNVGLPPGPIRIAGVDAIDAVLNYSHHTYLYMCANDDFSGTHKFASTYAEHLKNAERYSKALDERGIK